MPAIRTARERAREELTREIKEEARRQLGVEGAQQLSLRAVARELGMASSALYRYFPSRDDLLTALIVDAYVDLADSVDRAVAEQSGTRDARADWRALCTAVRDWARAKPHEYALIYGTPVPGYQAPQETIAPAARLPLALIDVVRGAAGRLTPPSPRAMPQALADQLAELAGRLALELPRDVLVRVMVAWTQLFGMVSFELFGHLAGSADPADAFFAEAVEQMADYVGLP